MKTAALFLLLATFTSGVFADTAADQQHIEQMMRQTWERPDAPLEVGPITVEGNHAVAGWTQGDRGGRALLRKSHDGWRVVLCAGDALLEASTLRNSGVPSDDADALSTATAKAEQSITPKRVNQFALFKGVMRVDKEQSHKAH
jgi:hypothetical protein